MNTLKIISEGLLDRNNDGPMRLKRMANRPGYSVFGFLVLLWPIMQYLLAGVSETAGYIDPNIWLLILMSLICFLLIVGLCWWMLQWFWKSLDLPILGDMVVSFKKLELWQQLGFYWLSFASLLLAAVGVLIAVL